MRKCILCDNSSTKTNYTRPGLHYHAFPSNANRRRIWLEVLGIEHYFEWYRVCSDHFLQENYCLRRQSYLLKNAIPQPYNKKCNNYGFLNKKKHFENAAVNNFEPPSKLYEKIKLATTNDKNSYQKMAKVQDEQFEMENLVDNIQPIVKTFEVPVRTTTTKDYTLGNGLRCSVKNCSNRNSKDLSFFGYPNDPTMRKIWVEKTGLKQDFTEKIKKYIRVCGAHFDDNCFTNPEKNRLKSDAIPTLFFGNDLIEASNLSSSLTVKIESNCANKSSFSSSNYVANKDSEETYVLVSMDSTTCYAKNFDPDCRVPGCITSDIVFEDVGLFVPTTKWVNEWSSSLGLQLTVNSIVCERHFRPQDILYTKILVNGVSKTIKSLAPHALPVRSACNPVSLKTNVVPILTTHEHQFKRAKVHKADEHLFTKEINNVLDNTDKCSTTNISMSTDDIPCIESNLKKNQNNDSANSSLSITLEPIENSQIIEPSVNSFSKSTSTSSMSITLQPKPKHNLTSTINNNLPSVNLTHSFPSTSSSSVYNLPQQCPLENEQQEATSSFKMRGTLTSNSIIHPEFFGNQIQVLKPISAPEKTRLARQPEIKTLVISSFISLAKESDPHNSNSGTSINTSQGIITNGGITENIKEVDSGFIYEISKRIKLPSLSWKTKYISEENITYFYQQDNSGIFEKEIYFYNSLVPTILLYGKNYNCHTEFKSQNLLETFLKLLNNVSKCFGLYGFVDVKCIGYVEASSKDIQLCSGCQELLIDDFQTIKSKIIKDLENYLADKRARLLKLKK